MDPMIGTMLDDRYEILDVLGSGGMAVVYKAMCHRLNRLVAIKILKRDFGQDAELHRRFQTESQAVAMLSHPNIVSVYDVSSSETLDYIVMELIDGITLKQYMQKKGVLTWREALHFSLQIASALDHAHSRGIIHRDIKPHNIMILKDGSIKVADFGIARVLSADNTLTRETLGSVHYISPEQARGGRIDQRTDLYSLGVVMYEMLTGQLPYDGDSAVSIAIKHIGGQCPEPKTLNPEIPEGLNQIVMHAMSVDPAERYASAMAMTEDLEAFRKDQRVVFSYVHAEPPAPTPEEEPKQQTEQEEARQRRGSRVVTVIVIAFMLLAFVGIGYFLYSYILRDLFSASEELPAPDLQGVYYTELTGENYPDFKLVVDEWTTSNTVEYGYVVSQEPKAKKNVKPGATIRVTVSSGREENAMPRLVNLNQGAAEQRLKNMELGLEVQIVRETSETFVSGQVIRSDPEAGTSLNRGETVTLYVSSGAEIELVLVPELIGMNVDEALEQIRAYGLEPGTVVYRTDEAAADTVIFQSVSHNTQVKASTVINLRVSSGSEEEDPEKDPEDKLDSEDDPQEQQGETPDEHRLPSVDPKPEDPKPETWDGSVYDAGNPKPGQYTRSVLNVDLPVGVGTVTVSLLCDGVKYGDSFIADLEQRSVQIAVYGAGSREFDVLVNGSRISYMTVDFPEE